MELECYRAADSNHDAFDLVRCIIEKLVEKKTVMAGGSLACACFCTHSMSDFWDIASLQSRTLKGAVQSLHIDDGNVEWHIGLVEPMNTRPRDRARGVQCFHTPI